MKYLQSVRIALCLFTLSTYIQSKLVVYGPEELIAKFASSDDLEDQDDPNTTTKKVKKPVINANYANFGHIPYGQSMIGTIYFDPDNEMMCKKSDPQTINEIEKSVTDGNKETLPTKIILARRGECTFVNKVRNAVHAGASLLVVVDSRVENITSVIMGDDGTGTGIRIPSMLIGKTDGEILIEFAKQRLGATLSAEFAVQEKKNAVDIEIWYSSYNQRSLDFVKEFDKYAHKLQGYLNMKPRFISWGCPSCSAEFKNEECFSNGAYCAPNHVKDDFNRITGREIIEEDLRQSCLHTILSKSNQEVLWWDYIKEVHAECFGAITESCSKNAHTILMLDFDATKKCVNESFLGPDHSKVDNTILKDNSQTWKDYGTLYWPSVTINRMTFRGDMTPQNVVEDICANLAVKPQVCIDFYKKEHIKYEETTVQGPDAVSAELLIVVVCVLVGVNIVLIIAYRRCVKKEMEDTMGFKVSSAVSQYISVAQTANEKSHHQNTSLEME